LPLSDSLNDWFSDCRAAVAVACRDMLADAGADDFTVVEQDQLNEQLVTIPALVVCFNASERQIGGTNARDDFAFPIQVAYLNVQAGQGANLDTGDPPPGELTPFQFRTLLRERFHHRRSVSVSGIDVFLVEYDPEGAVIDVDRPAFQQLRAASVINVLARVPRGS
jgi:hypothetical protein